MSVPMRIWQQTNEMNRLIVLEQIPVRFELPLHASWPGLSWPPRSCGTAVPHCRDRRDKPGDDAPICTADSKRPESALESLQYGKIRSPDGAQRNPGLRERYVVRQSVWRWGSRITLRSIRATGRALIRFPDYLAKV